MTAFFVFKRVEDHCPKSMLTWEITFRKPPEPGVKLWRLLQLSGNADGYLGQKWPERYKIGPTTPVHEPEVHLSEKCYFLYAFAFDRTKNQLK